MPPRPARPLPRAPRSYRLVAPLALAVAAATTGCTRPEPLEVRATSSLSRVGATEVLQIDVDTAPGANVRANDATYAHSWSATADASGHAVFRIDLPEPFDGPATPTVIPPTSPTLGGAPYGRASPVPTTVSPLLRPELTLSITADKYTSRRLFKGRYASASTKVVVKRAAALRYDPATRRLACIGKPCAGVFTAYREGKLEFSDIEPLATVELGGAKARTVTRQLSVSLPLDRYLEKVPLDDMFKAYPMGSVDLPLAVGFPDGVTLRGNVNVPANLLRPALVETLGQVARVPVRFHGEEATGGNHTSLLSLPGAQLFGNAATVRELDLVAVTTDKDHPGCRKDETSIDADVTVYERRTGKAIGQRRHPAPNCTDDYDSEAVATWLRTFVKASL